ncbi:MAG: Uma2 family endonuclease [Actinomycetota bacterium]
MQALQAPAEQRILLENVSWETYERLVAERQERPAPRFFYDRGVLELVSPSSEHEAIGHIIAALIVELAVEVGIDVWGAGSTTYRSEDLKAGFEPDGSFYFAQNAQKVRGKKRIELGADPPPDLVVEVDITSFSMNKLPIYARLGIPEVWRHDGRRLAILGLRRDGEGYAEASESKLLSPATADVLTTFVADGLKSSLPEWGRRVRSWAREATS